MRVLEFEDVRGNRVAIRAADISSIKAISDADRAELEERVRQYVPLFPRSNQQTEEEKEQERLRREWRPEWFNASAEIVVVSRRSDYVAWGDSPTITRTYYARESADVLIDTWKMLLDEDRLDARLEREAGQNAKG